MSASDLSPSFASLPMYDWPQMGSAHDEFWRAISGALQKRGIELSGDLVHGAGAFDVWHDPGMILSQTCGYPLATSLKGKVRYVATPIYDVEGCKGPKYSSAIVVGKDSGLKFDGLWGKVFAFNSIESLSGYRAARALFGNMSCFFGKTMKSGGHQQSARMVAAGEADVAALDAVCWHLLQRHEPETAGQLKVLGWTKSLPALPFITSLETPETTIDHLKLVLAEVIHDPNLVDVCRMMTISGIATLPVSDYDRLSRY